MLASRREWYQRMISAVSLPAALLSWHCQSWTNPWRNRLMHCTKLSRFLQTKTPGTFLRHLTWVASFVIHEAISTKAVHLDLLTCPRNLQCTQLSLQPWLFDVLCGGSWVRQFQKTSTAADLPWVVRHSFGGTCTGLGKGFGPWHKRRVPNAVAKAKRAGWFPPQSHKKWVKRDHLIILRGILLKHVEFTNQVLIIVCYVMLRVFPKSLRRRRGIFPCGPGSLGSCRCCSTHGSSDLSHHSLVLSSPSLRHVSSGACYFLEKWKLYYTQWPDSDPGSTIAPANPRPPTLKVLFSWKSSTNDPVLLSWSLPLK